MADQPWSAILVAPESSLTTARPATFLLQQTMFGSPKSFVDWYLIRDTAMRWASAGTKNSFGNFPKRSG